MDAAAATSSLELAEEVAPELRGLDAQPHLRGSTSTTRS
jgi:hypothetical protein